MTPGRKFSTTTSAVARSRRTASTAGGVLRSWTMLFFPALSCPKLVLAPLRSGGRVRIMSPSGASSLITSAPRSARRRVQCGPAIVVVKSTTRSRSKALVIAISSPCAALSMRQDLAEEQPGAFALRAGKKLLRRTALDDLAAVHEHHRVGVSAREPHLMRHAHHR